jgi:hypothetical protein
MRNDCSETHHGFRASLGRGDPCTQYCEIALQANCAAVLHAHWLEVEDNGTEISR